MTRDVTVIGVPLDLGAGRRGVDMGPSAFRVAEVDQTMRELGCEVEDAGDVSHRFSEKKSCRQASSRPRRGFRHSKDKRG